MKTQNKILKMVIICLLVSSILTCCGSNTNQSIAEDIDSQTYFSIIVPNCTNNTDKIFFQLPFYRFAINNDEIADDINEAGYILGVSAILTGENVDQLNGGTVYVQCTEFSEVANSEYYEELTDEYSNTILQSNTYINHDKLLKKVKKYLSSFNKSIIISCNLTFYGTINKDVTIKSLSIPLLDFTFDFQNFEVTVQQLPEGVQLDANGSIIDSAAGEGTLVSPVIEEVGYLFLDGEAMHDINSINVFSASDLCEIITNDNYDKYRETLHEALIDRPSNEPTSFCEGQMIDIQYYYIYPAYSDKISGTDIVANTFITEIVTNEGDTYWKYGYGIDQSPGEYLPLKLLEQNNIH